jgi:hypothetical protein
MWQRLNRCQRTLANQTAANAGAACVCPLPTKSDCSISQLWRSRPSFYVSSRSSGLGHGLPRSRAQSREARRPRQSPELGCPPQHQSREARRPRPPGPNGSPRSRAERRADPMPGAQMGPPHPEARGAPEFRGRIRGSRPTAPTSGHQQRPTGAPKHFAPRLQRRREARLARVL